MFTKVVAGLTLALIAVWWISFVYHLLNDSRRAIHVTIFALIVGHVCGGILAVLALT